MSTGFDTVQESQFFSITHVVGRIVTFACLIFHVMSFAILSSRFMEIKSERNESYRMVRLIFLNSFTSILFSMGGNLLMVPFYDEFGIELCEVAVKVTTIGYLSSMWIIYMILLLRVEVVTMRRPASTRLLNFLFLVTKFSTYFGTPVLMLSSVFFFEGVVVFNRFCFHDFALWLNVLFAVMDSVLSLNFLVLFLVPFFTQIKGVETTLSAGHVRQFRSAAKKNLRLSLVQIISTLAVMSATLIFAWLFPDESSPSTTFLRTIGGCAFQVD